MSAIESFDQQPLAEIIPSYLYQEYATDANLQAFIDTFNAMAQGYLNWFLSTPLCLYTNPNIYGMLLDWVGVNLFGVARPVISNNKTLINGELASVPVATLAMATLFVSKSGTSVIANDDLYKRLITWFQYRGDGMQMSALWLKRRIARFIYGINGSDVDISLANTISLEQVIQPWRGPYNTTAYNTQAYNSGLEPTDHTLACAIPSYPASFSFQALIQAGIIPLPFQVSITIRPGFWLGLTTLGTATLGG